MKTAARFGAEHALHRMLIKVMNRKSSRQNSKAKRRKGRGEDADEEPEERTKVKMMIIIRGVGGGVTA